jgi:exonuclease SbcC
MSSGKYSFALDETASGNAQAGLGIDIADAWSGQTRDPATLSGGETFYASLALALGLADVVREESGGVTLETLFVDEGFGSLDADTLSIVLDQLDALRARGRAVGVISHVAEMKEWVHDRIEVVPGPTPAAGSSLRQSGA